MTRNRVHHITSELFETYVQEYGPDFITADATHKFMTVGGVTYAAPLTDPVAHLAHHAVDIIAAELDQTAVTA